MDGPHELVPDIANAGGWIRSADGAPVLEAALAWPGAFDASTPLPASWETSPLSRPTFADQAPRWADASKRLKSNGQMSSSPRCRHGQTHRCNGIGPRVTWSKGLNPSEFRQKRSPMSRKRRKAKRQCQRKRRQQRGWPANAPPPSVDVLPRLMEKDTLVPQEPKPVQSLGPPPDTHEVLVGLAFQHTDL